MFSLSKSSGFLSPVRFILLIVGIYITMGLTAYLVLTTEWRKMSKAKWETSCFPVCVYGFKKKSMCEGKVEVAGWFIEIYSDQNF